MREVYIDATSPVIQDVFWGYDGENNSATLKIKLPDYMIGEKFSYKACFENAHLEQSSITPTVSNGICSAVLTSDLAVKGRLKVQIVGHNPSDSHNIKVPGSPEKIQVVYPSGATLTKNRTDTGLFIASIDAYGNIVETGSSDTIYEIWTINRSLQTNTVYDIRIKVNNQWLPDVVKFTAINEQLVKTPVFELNIT